MTDNSTEKKSLFLLFFASGISGLMYEVIWLRILSRILGVTTYATSITLAAFMAGLGIGSYFFGKIGDRGKGLLKVYAFLQIFTGLTAVLTPFLFSASVPLYKYVYDISGHSGSLVMASRAVISFFTLLIPATLMGGTLPVITSHITKKDMMFGSNLSVLYGLNTFGAVIGVLLSGFFTIGALGEWQTVLIAVAINLAVAGAALGINRKEDRPGKATSGPGPAAVDPAISPYPDNIRRFALLAVLISGFTALAYEVIWTRQLILYLEVSIYAFSAMLAVFLTGVAAGSLVMDKIINKLKKPLFVFGVLEAAVGVLSLINLYIFPLFDGTRAVMMLSPFVLVFPMTFVFGMIFPVASLCFAKSVSRAGSSIGTVYLFNTAGNLLGSLVTGFILISLIGSTKSILLLAAINLLAGYALIYLEPGLALNVKNVSMLGVPLAALLFAGAYNKDVFLEVVSKMVCAGIGDNRIFFNKECVQGTVTSYDMAQPCSQGGKRSYGIFKGKGLAINGVLQTTLCTETKLMAHLPLLLADERKKMLIICFGMGTIVRSAAIYRDLNVDVVELVPEIYKCFQYFHSDAAEILKNEKLKLHVEDGRNYLLLSPEKYDVINVDPSPPVYSAGTVNLYSEEFFRMCREHLTPGGVMCLWFPGAGVADELMVIKTFISVFPEMSVWKGPRGIGFYLIGKLKGIKIDKAGFERAFKDKKLVDDLSEYEKICVNSRQLLDLYFSDAAGFAKLIKKYPVITDNNPYTEFPLFR